MVVSLRASFRRFCSIRRLTIGWNMAVQSVTMPASTKDVNATHSEVISHSFLSVFEWEYYTPTETQMQQAPARRGWVSDGASSAALFATLGLPQPQSYNSQIAHNQATPQVVRSDQRNRACKVCDGHRGQRHHNCDSNHNVSQFDTSPWTL